MAPRKAAAKAPRKAASKTAAKPASLPRGSQARPEADAEAPPTYRADMGEGLPPQKDTLNPNRAK
jgi:hypothetical protein